jgi:hypothetical protein
MKNTNNNVHKYNTHTEVVVAFIALCVIGFSLYNGVMGQSGGGTGVRGNFTLNTESAVDPKIRNEIVQATNSNPRTSVDPTARETNVDPRARDAQVYSPSLSQAEAYKIGQRDCIKNGDVIINPIQYKGAQGIEWSYDITLATPVYGCNAYCFVNNQTLKGQINWHCPSSTSTGTTGTANSTSTGNYTNNGNGSYNNASNQYGTYNNYGAYTGGNLNFGNNYNVQGANGGNGATPNSYNPYYYNSGNTGSASELRFGNTYTIDGIASSPTGTSNPNAVPSQNTATINSATNTNTLSTKNCHFITRYHSFGDRGGDVPKIQTFLKERNYYKGRIDGVYGIGTFKAVQAFQKDTLDKTITVWGENKPTGRTYISTKYAINNAVGCPDPDTIIPKTGVVLNYANR